MRLYKAVNSLIKPTVCAEVLLPLLLIKSFVFCDIKYDNYYFENDILQCHELLHVATSTLPFRHCTIRFLFCLNIVKSQVSQQ